MADVEAILRRQAWMESDRSSFEALWEDVARYLLPRQGGMVGSRFGSTFTSQGQRQTDRIFDERAMQALDDGIAVFEGYVMPRGARWQMIEPRDDALMKNRRVREWYELKTSQLFALRSNPDSGFDTQAHESVASLLSFGFQGMWPDLLRDNRGKPLGIFYRSEHIGTLYAMENAYGRIDVVHRKFTLTARQAEQMWPDNVPECARKALSATNGDRSQEKHQYLNAIEPNKAHEPGRLDAKGKPIAACYIAIEGKELIVEGGYRSMPLIASRFDKSPTETYGRSPGITVLPAVRASQRIAADLVTAVELMARPPLGAHDDMLDQTIRYSPHGITFGAFNARGEKLIGPLIEGADITPALALQERTRAVIARAFYGDMLRIRQEQKTHLLNADVMEQLQEKGVLLAPLGRQETEWFSPMAAREIDLMHEMGLLDDMPPEVVEAGGVYQMRYDNPLARMQKADQAAGYFRLLEGVTPLIQAKPALVDAFLAKFPFDKVLTGLAYINAVPASWEADAQEKAATGAAMASAAQASQLLEAAPVVSKVAKELAQAQSMGGGAGVAG